MPAVTVTTVSGTVLFRDFDLHANENVITLWAEVGKFLGRWDFDLTFGIGSLFQIDDSVDALPGDCILTAVVNPEINEYFDTLGLLQREMDPYVGITVKVYAHGSFVKGRVQHISVGCQSGKKLYDIKYENGDEENYTLKRLLVYADPRVDAVSAKRAWEGKIRCSLCEQREYLTSLKYNDGVFLCETCTLRGYWLNAVETHHCGHCGFEGGATSHPHPPL